MARTEHFTASSKLTKNSPDAVTHRYKTAALHRDQLGSLRTLFSLLTTWIQFCSSFKEVTWKENEKGWRNSMHRKENRVIVRKSCFYLKTLQK